MAAHADCQPAHPRTGDVQFSANFNTHRSGAVGRGGEEALTLPSSPRSPTKACQVITVCLMLHNRARKLALTDLESDSNDSGTDSAESDSEEAAVPAAAAVEGAVPPNERGRTATDKVARNHLIETHF